MLTLAGPGSQRVSVSANPSPYRVPLSTSPPPQSSWRESWAFIYSICLFCPDGWVSFSLEFDATVLRGRGTSRDGADGLRACDAAGGLLALSWGAGGGQSKQSQGASLFRSEAWSLHLP